MKNGHVTNRKKELKKRTTSLVERIDEHKIGLNFGWKKHLGFMETSKTGWTKII
jgi:hypothetical protein